MAVNLVPVQQYQGLSTDSKPAAGKVTQGIEFRELDTGKVYVAQESGWVLREAPITQVVFPSDMRVVFQDILRELHRIRLAQQIQTQNLLPVVDL